MRGSYQPSDRRPIASRRLGVIQWTSKRLAGLGISANVISVASIVFAVGAGLALAVTSQSESNTVSRVLWGVAAVGVQLRLLANLFDGMVAVETATASPVGELYNEVPDRVSDCAILVGLGASAGGSLLLGIVAALVAVFVAYVRAMGVVAGAKQVFVGPQAKPQRMFLVTVVCLLCSLAPTAWLPRLQSPERGAAAAILLIVVIGGLVTALRRLLLISRELRTEASHP